MTDDMRSQKPNQQEPEDQYESSDLHSEKYCPVGQTRSSGRQDTSGSPTWHHLQVGLRLQPESCSDLHRKGAMQCSRYIQ